MKILMFDRVPEAIAWAKERINITGNVSSDLTTVALVDDNNQFQAVTVYSAYTSQNIDMHIAADKSRNWLSRSYFNASFYLPFRVLEVPRVTGLIKAGNERSAHFVERLGFTLKGVCAKRLMMEKTCCCMGSCLKSTNNTHGANMKLTVALFRLAAYLKGEDAEIVLEAANKLEDQRLWRDAWLRAEKEVELLTSELDVLRLKLKHRKEKECND